MRDRPRLPTTALAVVWFLSGLVALAVLLVSHPPVPDGASLRAVVTTQVAR